jgi:tetratricopeptide (TPR) repeat protein
MPPTLLHRMPALALFIALLLALGLGMARADTKADIEADLREGRYTQADQRLQAVRQKHPDNALAAYWHAQVLHKLARDDEARAALQRAVQLDPSLAFAAQKATLNTLAAQLRVPLTASVAGAARGDDATVTAAPVPDAPRATAPPARSGSVWPWALGLGALGWLLWRWSRRRAAEASQAFAQRQASAQGYQQATWQGHPAPAPAGVSGLGAAAIGVGAALATGAVLAAVSHGTHDHDDGTGHLGGGGDDGRGDATPDFDLGGSGGDFDGGGDFGGDSGGAFD